VYKKQQQQGLGRGKPRPTTAIGTLPKIINLVVKVASKGLQVLNGNGYYNSMPKLKM
jgi:hypothetical protein